MKIYTKGGDGGETSLFGGQRVRKDHERVEAYGAVDEANAILGVAIAHVTDPEIGELLTEVQAQLFELGALLATPAGTASSRAVAAIEERHITELERLIDEAERELPPLKRFILPGGTATAAHLHHARTVVRRAERRTVGLVDGGAVDSSALRYLNRLSDFLFVFARLANRRAGETETTWSKG